MKLASIEIGRDYAYQAPATRQQRERGEVPDVRRVRVFGTRVPKESGGSERYVRVRHLDGPGVGDEKIVHPRHIVRRWEDQVAHDRAETARVRARAVAMHISGVLAKNRFAVAEILRAVAEADQVGGVAELHIEEARRIRKEIETPPDSIH